MIANLLLGTVVISATVLIHTFGLMAVTDAMAWVTGKFPMNGHPSRTLEILAADPA